MANIDNTTQRPRIEVIRRDIKGIKNISKIGEPVAVKTMICKAEIKQPKNGGAEFMVLDVQDSTGIMLGSKIWGDQLIKMDDELRKTVTESSGENPVCVELGGYVESYLGNVYLNVKNLRVIRDVNPNDFVPRSEFNLDDMYEYIWNIANELREPYRTILINDLKDKKEEFTSAPAAKRYHDNFRGGLLEHTYNMLKAYMGVADLYPLIDKEIMIFLIIQHDFEKINGYTLLPSIEWTYQEELVGHQVMGAISVYNKLKEHDVEDGTIMAILNGLLAHHGKAEWGAVKPALTAEARLLSHIDYMISDISKTVQVIKDKNFEEGTLDREIYYKKYQ